jgi:hypothetical protein
LTELLEVLGYGQLAACGQGIICDLTLEGFFLLEGFGFGVGSGVPVLGFTIGFGTTRGNFDLVMQMDFMESDIPFTLSAACVFAWHLILSGSVINQQSNPEVVYALGFGDFQGIYDIGGVSRGTPV